MDEKFLKNILESSSNYKAEFTSKLIQICEKFIPDIESHLKNISQTLPNFDIHDESHAESVLKNMLTISNYYEENFEKLTDIEYFLIIFSAYLHDSGMALPKWQLNIFKATEGDDCFNIYEDIPLKINNDGKKSFSFSKAREWVKENKELIYTNYSTVEKFIFSEINEETFIDSLATSLIDYQEFRNGYTPDLNNIKEKTLYIKKSEDIRYEYIRSKHHIFSARNCELLAYKLEANCGKFYANKLCNDLSKIVIGHGLNSSEIKGYSLRSNYSEGNYANQFFITILLRLGDIIHFSSDRSPESLLSSKLIQDPISLIHWKVKQEDINFWLNSFNEKGRREISYSAYFKEPKLYYFFQDYMNWIDMEISNYNIFLNILEKNTNLSKISQKYDLKLADKVNRSEVLYDKNLFVPVDNLKFVLNQNKILDLLMSVGLYKDKYLCLRELYQNSMDACKCAIAGNLIKKGIIEFGIEEDSNGKYLYCLDNGMGMTKEIIENYFLNIGTSYYQSREFYELKAKWEKGVSNTSQFGVGILSCFMIGNEIEVVTKNLYEQGNNIISFKIDGPHENFYYKKNEEIDIEKIGNSGTLIKIYLSDQEINNHYIEDFDMELFAVRNNRFSPENHSNINLKSNVYFILFDSINIVPSEINVSVKLDNGISKSIINNFKPLNLEEISKQKIINIMKKSYNQEYRDKLIYLKEKWNDCNIELVEVSSENICITSAIVFCQGDDQKLINNISSYPLLKRGGLVSINGVIVEEYGKIKGKFDRIFQKDINSTQPFIIDFNGINKPKLSVDRLSITDFSDELYLELKDLIEQLKLKMFEKINTILENSDNKELLLEKLIGNMEIFKLDWIELLIKKEDNAADQLFKKLKDYLLDIDHISDFFIAGKNKVKYNLLINNLSKHEWIVYLSKILDAEKIELFDDYFEITTTKELKINQSLLEDYQDGKIVPFLTYADNWDSYFAEYDIITGLYPIVSSNLFVLTEPEYHNDTVINGRIKWLGNISNGLSGIGNLQSVQLLPEFGFGSIRRKEWHEKKYPSRILNFENRLNSFWLFELNSSGKTIKDNHKDYVLRAFISPTILSTEEVANLDNIKEKYPIYYKGVYNGWSVVFLGKTAEIAYLSGKHKFDEVLKNISGSFSNPENINYYLINGKNINF
ncbi:hypothetical protein [Carnobacterium maltaromaticum]|uniref:HD domain-containing protein n=1 Tax=Carnobacterium maltaromaticum TaxID=2751 RepID=UPI0039BE3F09